MHVCLGALLVLLWALLVVFWVLLMLLWALLVLLWALLDLLVLLLLLHWLTLIESTSWHMHARLCRAGNLSGPVMHLHFSCLLLVL
jgi:hypothetical protein